eukprot:6468154-Amphidinium_carterae.2
MWESVLAEDVEEQESVANTTHEEVANPWSTVLASDCDGHALVSEQEVSWDSVLASSDLAVEPISNTQVDAGGEGLSNLASFQSPPKKRRGRPSKALSHLPSVEHVVQQGRATSGSSDPAVVVAPTILSNPILQPGVGSSGARSSKDILNIPAVRSYVLQRPRGYSALSLNTEALVECAKQAKSATLFDEHYTKIHEEYIGSGLLFHNASAVMRAKVLGLDDKVLEAKVVRLAAAQTCYHRMA